LSQPLVSANTVVSGECEWVLKNHLSGSHQRAIYFLVDRIRKNDLIAERTPRERCWRNAARRQP